MVEINFHFSTHLGIHKLRRVHYATLSVVCGLLATYFWPAHSPQSDHTVITFKGKDVPLINAFTAIERQTGYTVFYDGIVLKRTGKITLDVKDVPLEEFMKICLKDQFLDFRLQGNVIFVTLRSHFI